MEVLALASLAALVLLYGLVSERIQTTVICGPMVFVGAGLLLGGMGLGIVELPVESPFVEGLTELTLTLILFVDASRIDLATLRRQHDIPIRLLAVGLPLTIVAGGLTGRLLLPALTLTQVIVLAVILAPTDAALGLPVVTNRKVPVRIRQALNVESGLNDGIALPFLLFFVTMATAAGTLQSGSHWARFALLQITLGPLAGIAVGYIGGRLVEMGASTGWMSGSFQRLSVLALSVLAYTSAELIGGNGFIAAFTAGITLGNFSRVICGRLYEFGEAEGQLLMLITFLVFGAVMVPAAVGYFDGATLFYGVLSLTAVRMIPVALSLLGLGLKPTSMLFVGWFGPRGIASIIYGLLVLEELGRASEPIFGATVLTVLLSVFAHGLTAWPLSRWYGERAESMRRSPDMPEMAEVAEMPARFGYRN